MTKSRLGLSASDVGIRKKDGFLSEYLKLEGCEQNLDDLSEEKHLHLGNWINALYLAEGLSDELFTKCSPHDFYLLIPTLLRQSVTAFQQGKLTKDSLKAGLDCKQKLRCEIQVLIHPDLLEPFLLPSLISGLSWAAGALEHDHPIIEKVLDVLTKASGTAESREIHHTILAMCAPRLQVQLKVIESKTGSFDAVHKVLDHCEDFALMSEREIQKEGSGLVNLLQQDLLTLITSTESLDQEQNLGLLDISALVARVVEVHGADAALRGLTGVLLQLSDGHHFLFALDAVTTAISVAGDVLQDALRLQYHNLGGLLQTGDTLKAEAIVRLYRQVEAYKSLLIVQDMVLDTMFAQQLADIDNVNPNLDAATAVSGGMDMQDLQTDSNQPDGIDQVLDEVAAMGNLDSVDADMSFDALYGLQGNDMDLNDLDLDMF